MKSKLFEFLSWFKINSLVQNQSYLYFASKFDSKLNQHYIFFISCAPFTINDMNGAH